jgi:hypothetical protein
MEANRIMDFIQLTDDQLVALIAGQIYAADVEAEDKEVSDPRIYAKIDPRKTWRAPDPKVYAQIKPTIERAYNLHMNVKRFLKERQEMNKKGQRQE